MTENPHIFNILNYSSKKYLNFSNIRLTLDNEFVLITVASILINVAIFLATFTFKKAQKHYSSIFCLVYLQIVWSSLIGFFIFDEILNSLAFLGALFIVFSGIISIPGQFKQISYKSLLSVCWIYQSLGMNYSRDYLRVTPCNFHLYLVLNF